MGVGVGEYEWSDIQCDYVQAEAEVQRIESELNQFKGKSNVKGQSLFGL